MKGVLCGMWSSISGLNPLVMTTSSSVLTTKDVSKYCQVPWVGGWGGCKIASHWNLVPYRNVNGSSGKESACQCKRCRFNPWAGKIPWSRKWQPTLVFMEFSMNRRTWQATVYGVTRVGCDLATEHTQKCNRDNPCQAVLDNNASLETAPWNLQKDLG